MKKRARCGECNKFVKAVPVEKPRAEGEINYVCKEHGVVNTFVEFIEIKKRDPGQPGKEEKS